MKFSLSNKSQGNFTQDSEGHLPYEAKVSIPVSKIFLAKSVNTVRSNGLTARFYANARKYNASGGRITSLVNGEEKYLGVLSIVKFYYDQSFPPVFSISDTISGWALKLTGKFRADATGSYAFYFCGEGQIHSFKFNSVEKISTPLIIKTNLTSNQTISVTGLTAGNWYSLEIIYASFQVPGNPSGLSILWKETSMPEAIILSAGVTALETDSVVTGEFPIPYQELSHITDIELSRSKNSMSTLKFKVPLVASDSIYQLGYSYRPYDNSFYDLSSTSNAFKQFYTVRLMDGYRNTLGQDELVTQFVGQIREIQTSSKSELEVTAYDFSIFAKDAINKESPSPIDYTSFGYLSEITGHVNGLKKPQAYDGWELHKAVENLMVNSYIDPYLFTKKKIFTNRAGTIVNGGFLITGVSSQPLNYLPTPTNYGNSDFVEGDQGTKDDAYLYQISVGENYFDSINKIIEPYAMTWGFTSSGFPYIKSYNTPGYIIDDRDTSTVTYSSGWTSATDINCIKATYKYATSKNASCSANCTGSKFNVITRLGPTYGSTDLSKYNAKVIIRKNGSIISQSSYNLYHSLNHAYYDGPALDLGYNPSILPVGQNLTYDTYNISLVKTTSDFTIAFDGIFIYDEDLDNPYIKLKSGDLSTPASIINMNIGENAAYLKNESIVVGARLGTKTAQGDHKIFDTINPNNPVYEHIISRTVDLNSIYKSTASNYVGREITTLVFDPSISDQDQADFIGFSLVDEYHNPHKEIPDIECLNNPLIDIGDCLAIRDNGKSLVNYEKVWVESITNARNGIKSTMKITTVPVKPVTSWFSKPEPKLSDFSNQPFQNVEIYNGGLIAHLNQHLYFDDTEITVNEDLASAPPSGYLQIIGRPIVKDSKNYIYPMDMNNEILFYSSRSTAGVVPGKIYGLNRGLQYTFIGADPNNQSGFVVGTEVNLSWDSYTQDSLGISPLVKFDLVATGDVQCFIYAYPPSSPENATILTKVDNLTWNGKDEIDSSKKFLTWGASKIFTYGGADNYGQWNQQSNDPLIKVYKNSYVAEKYTKFSDNGLYYLMEPYTKYKVELKLKTKDGSQYSYNCGNIKSRRGALGRVNFIERCLGLSLHTPFDIYTWPDGGAYDVTLPSEQGPWFVHDLIGERKLRFFNAVHLRPTSNNGKGMKYNIIEQPLNLNDISGVLRNDTLVDPKYYRYYGGKISANMRTIIYKYHKNGGIWHDSNFLILNETIDFYDQKDINQLFNTNITGVVDRYFNPKTINSSLTSIPLEARNAIVENYTHTDRHDEAFKFYKFIFFTGYFVDKSGRQPFQYPTNLDYYSIIPGRSGKNIYKENAQFFENYEHINHLTSSTILNTNLGFYKGTDRIGGETAWRGNWIAWEDLNEVGGFPLLDGINGEDADYGPGEAIFVRNIGINDIG